MKNLFLFCFIICLNGVFCISAKSQIMDVKSAVQNKTTNRINNRIDRGIDKGLDAVEDGITGKKKPAKTKEEQNVTKENTENAVQESDNTEPKAVPQDKPSFQSYSKYDFIPGEKVIFYDDFSETNVGDFPANWNTTGSGEVVTTNLYPGNWFKIGSSGGTVIDGGIKLPDNFTVEYDVILHPMDESYNYAEFGFYLDSSVDTKDLNEGGAVPGLNGGIKMVFGNQSSYSAYNPEGYTQSGEKTEAYMENGKKYRISIWVQKTRLRVYLNETKVFDLPKIFDKGLAINMMRFELWDSGIPMITNFRVAAGQPDTRSKLLTEGKLVSYGIYFDVNKDIVKPESYGTLKEIAEVLKENPTVRVKIVGHTDSDGADAANLDLSKRRGTAVKNELIKNFGIDASRLESDGLGETKPVAPNDNQANKAMNRRVEFIKL